MSEGPLPLDGLRVVDLTRILAGPLATQNLADLGADVIKIERPPDGDDTRSWGPPWSGKTATYHQALNRNKRSLALDLSVESDRGRLLELVASADVLVENFRPGSLGRMGLSRDVFNAANPQLVHCSITSFGSNGPGADLAGYDLLIQAASGLMHITGEDGGEPTKVGVALVDVITGLQATVAVLAGLEKRRKHERGCHVEVALFDSAVSSLINQASGWLMAGSAPRRQGNRHPSIAPYGVFRASDGDFVVACGSDAQWLGLCSVIDPALAKNATWQTNAGRRNDLDRLELELNETFGSGEVEHWVRLLGDAGVPAGRINDVPQAFDLAAELERDLVISHPGGYRGVAGPIIIDGERVSAVRRPPPALGADSQADW